MTNRAVARVELDRADKPIASGANTVFTNKKKTAHAGSVTLGGAVVVQGAQTVFVENRAIARAADATTKGPIKSGSTTVFAGDNNATTQTPIQLSLF